jgi:hypothetical protein
MRCDRVLPEMVLCLPPFQSLRFAMAQNMAEESMVWQSMLGFNGTLNKYKNLFV